MNPVTLDASTAKSRILQIIEKNPFVSFGTFGADGWPDLRVLLIAAKDGVESIWFATSTDSVKVAELRQNPKAVIYGYELEPMAEFRLFGNVELLSDPESRRKAWQDDFTQYFPDGVDSPDMIVLRFNTDHGIYDCYGREIGKF